MVRILCSLVGRNHQQTEETMWYNTDGHDKSIVLSTRIRFARNIDGYPFPSRLDHSTATEIVDIARKAANAYDYTDFASLSPLEAMAYGEKRLVSADFAKQGGLPRGLLVRDDLYIMINEEDHLRLQGIKSGLAISQAFAEAKTALAELALPFSFDEKLGYLTHCPTNLGTGMRASVMMFLPGISMAGKVDELMFSLSRMGFAIRGMYGEGSQGGGCLYQVSNQVTMGISEEETVAKLEDVVARITQRENHLRSLLAQQGESLHDGVMRSYGTLKYARILTSDEFMQHYVNLRLGIAIGYEELGDIKLHTLDDLMTHVMPASLALSENTTDERTRDSARAKVVREFLENK